MGFVPTRIASSAEDFRKRLVRTLAWRVQPSRLSVYFFGGREGRGRLRRSACRRYPGLIICGVGPRTRDIEANQNPFSRVCPEIVATQPAFAVVALGSPPQEVWQQRFVPLWRQPSRHAALDLTAGITTLDVTTGIRVAISPESAATPAISTIRNERPGVSVDRASPVGAPPAARRWLHWTVPARISVAAIDREQSRRLRSDRAIDHSFARRSSAPRPKGRAVRSRMLDPCRNAESQRQGRPARSIRTFQQASLTLSAIASGSTSSTIYGSETTTPPKRGALKAG